MEPNEESIIKLLESTQREGMIDLIGYLQQEGFFESPASTKFHGVYQGGLAEHSLQVFNMLKDFHNRLQLDKVVSPGQKPLAVSLPNLIITCLLHDVCKIGAYIKSDKGGYYWNRQQPKGHALLSISRIEKFIKLEEIERMMIFYHMGVFGAYEFQEEGSAAGEYPLRGDHSKDVKLSKEESQKARYGQSLANAWFHNPICKFMYFCDEISTMEQK
jgi:hypothetical protein